MSKKDFNNQINDLRNNIAKNKREGYEPLITGNNLLGRFQPMVSSIALGTDPKSFCNTGSEDELNAGGFAINAGKLFAEPTLQVISVGDDVPGNGAVAWGARNTLPAYIYKTSKCLPYTAQGLEYQSNASVGIRPQFIYRYATVTNGILTEHYCDFHLAGTLLIAQIRDLRQRIKEEQANNSSTPLAPFTPPTAGSARSCATATPFSSSSPSSASVQGGSPATPLSYRTKPEPYTPTIPLSNIPDDELDSLKRELDERITDYREWYQADMELRKFEEDNDLPKLFNDLAQDDLALDLNFPLIGLEQGSKEKWASNEWIPKIVKVSFSPAVISRFEKKGDDQRSHYVYQSEKWRYHFSTRRTAKPTTTIAFPLIRWQDFQDDLDAYITAQKDKKGADKSAGWNAWYAVPNKHLSNELEYYTFPAWWSIYPSLAFLYATTLMFDKSVARQNDIAWRRIIYVDRGYLEDLYAKDEKGQDPKRQEEIRNDLEQKVNNFLSNKANNGKTLLVDSTISEDGKTLINSIRVETIPDTSSKSTEDEIHAISSVLFYALGLDPRLIGAVPGKQTSSSGTQARELELLNTKKLAVRRERIKRLCLYIAHHNRWCPNHIDCIIKDQTLSTLDASKTGIVETEN